MLKAFETITDRRLKKHEYHSMQMRLFIIENEQRKIKRKREKNKQKIK